MGFTEILTIAFIVLKLLGVISWSWWLVLLPEIIAVAIYLILIIIWLVSYVKLNRSIKRFDEKFKF